MTQRLRIAIASAGRFHVLDLARELHALGHDVLFYSYVPKRRAMHFGLPAECHIGLLPFVAPLVAWHLKASAVAPKLSETLLYAALNRVVMARLRPCDVFICMSGVYLEAARHARERYGARIMLVRGSKHVLAQDEILARVPGAERPSRFSIERELAGYELADRICVPSMHVVQSFASSPHLLPKLRCNPYGVDLAMFPQRGKSRRPDAEPEFLFAGTWSFQKGCDLLVEALDHVSGIRLRHVGPIGDAPFPFAHPRASHVDAVDQEQLVQHYWRSDCLVLPSRQDGFGMVLSQALACGLPILCTQDTGGPDLALLGRLAERIEIVASNDVGALSMGLTRMRDRLGGRSPFPPLEASDRELLGWRAYAERAEEELVDVMASASHADTSPGSNKARRAHEPASYC